MEMLSYTLEEVQKNRIRLREAESTEHRLAVLEQLLVRLTDVAKETSPRQSHSVTEEETKEDEPPVVSDSDNSSSYDGTVKYLYESGTQGPLGPRFGHCFELLL